MTRQKRTKRDHILGQTIKTRREKLGLSFRQLGKLAGVESSIIVRYENGETLTPKPDILTKLAQALEMPAADLYVLAGYSVPKDLPSLPNYLRAKSGLPEEAQEELVVYYRQLQKKHRTSKGKSPEAKTDS